MTDMAAAQAPETTACWAEWQSARDEVVRAALRSVLSEEFRADDNDEAVKQAELNDEELALAALSLVQATNRLPEGFRPVGWPS